jgi:DNA-binding NarL/FixJ family response regulator
VRLRCLIVDDSEEFLASARALLSAQGLVIVATATSGADAERLADLHRPEVALVDVQLGDEDGLEVARRLDAAPYRMRVILVSIHREQDLAELIDDSPALGFLAKSALSAHAVRALVASAPPGT